MRTILDEDAGSDPGIAFDDARVVRASDKALLVDLGEHGEHWIPCSQIHDNSEIYLDDHQRVQGSPGRLVITTWCAEQKGLA